jgi:hypothetical protein
MTSTTSTSSTLTPFDAFRTILDVELNAYTASITEGDVGPTSLMLCFGDSDELDGWIRLDCYIEDGTDTLRIDWKVRRQACQTAVQALKLDLLYEDLAEAVYAASFYSAPTTSKTAYSESIVGQ